MKFSLFLLFTIVSFDVVLAQTSMTKGVKFTPASDTIFMTESPHGVVKRPMPLIPPKTQALNSDTALLKMQQDRISYGMTFSTDRLLDKELPYPMLFVHGLNGGIESWQYFTSSVLGSFFDSNESVLMGYCLNNDENLYYSNALGDVSNELLHSNLPNASIYRVTFNCDPYGVCWYGGSDYWLSNQSAIYKQGKALGKAVNSILQATGKEKVILVGHGMGGLAIREYYQNSVHWIGNSSKVAKIVTVGTPHWGSDFEADGIFTELFAWIYSGIDNQSEAVRDLRSGYDIAGEFQHAGIFLWGDGYEDQNEMLDNLLFPWYNVDVNCNGVPGNYIPFSQSLNGRPLDASIEFGSVYDINDLVVRDYTLSFGYPNTVGWDRGGEDFCACLDAQGNGTAWCESFQADAEGGDGGHMALVTETQAIMMATDEPDCYGPGYTIYPNQRYLGFITQQDLSNPFYPTDWDPFRFTIGSPTEVTVSIPFENVSNTLSCHIVKASPNECNWIDQFGGLESISETQSTFSCNLEQPGEYYLEFFADGQSTFKRYEFEMTFGSISQTEAPETEKFVIYPNPANDVLRWIGGDESWPMTFRIFDISGRILKQGVLQGGSLSVEDLHDGAYVIEMRSNTKLHSSQFVIAR